MPRTDNDEEKCIAVGHLNRLGIEPSSIGEGPDPPDLKLLIDGKIVGLELTAYRSNEAQQELQGAWKDIEKLLPNLKQDFPALQRMRVGFYLNGKKKFPRKPDRPIFAKELVDVVYENLVGGGSESEVPFTAIRQKSLLGQYVCDIWIVDDESKSEWICMNAFSGIKADVALSLCSIAKKKSHSLHKNWERYSRAGAHFSQLWLLVHNGLMIDGTLAITEPELVAKSELLNSALAQSPFDRFIASHIGAIMWTRDAGWRLFPEL